MMSDVNGGNGGLYRIDGDGVLKVGDFGLSEDVCKTGYFRLDKGSSGVRLPFKWLAPESIHDAVFNDVVSNSFQTIVSITHACGIIPSVVIWCDMLGDIHMWQNPLSWCVPK